MTNVGSESALRGCRAESSILTNRDDGSHDILRFRFASNHEVDGLITGTLGRCAAVHGFDDAAGEAEPVDLFAQTGRDSRAGLIIGIEAGTHNG